MSYFSQPGDRLEPAETLLDPFPLPLAGAVNGMTRRSLVEGTATPRRPSFRDVGHDLHMVALGDEVGRIMTLVPTCRH